MRIVIYGAQGIALGAYKALKTIFPEREIDCFLVTEMGNNAPVLGGIPVRKLTEFVSGMSSEEKNNIEVLIGTPENVMPAIEKGLHEIGLNNSVRLDSIRWGQMQQNAFVKTGEFMPLSSYPIGCHFPVLRVFKMIHSKDKQLSTLWNDPDYIFKLQVGASLAENEIAPTLDNFGDNISEKNGNYSELTGLYWVWKNFLPDEDMNHYCGLAHYRRLFDFSEDDLLRLLDNDIDVVLPYPMPYEPNIEAHHLRYLTDSEWNAVLQALDELQPEYAVSFKEILKQGYYYNYNVLLAKNNVLQDYCNWLFPLLFRIEEINDPEGIKPPNRFMGYVGETLETLYFMHNKDKMRITHTGCKFLM